MIDLVSVSSTNRVTIRCCPAFPPCSALPIGHYSPKSPEPGITIPHVGPKYRAYRSQIALNPSNGCLQLSQ